MGDFSGFPKNLAYSIKNLSGFSKQTIKLLPDRWNTVNNGDTIRVKLPVNSLVQLNTFSMFAEGTCGGAQQHFPRLGLSSCIEALSVYVNGTLVETINRYNALYNTIFDMQGAGIDQGSKRFLEVIDPSVTYTAIDTSGYITGKTTTLTTTTKDTKKVMMVNNWLGFLGSANGGIAVIDTADLGDVYVEIRFSNDKVLWSSYLATYVAPTGYTLDNIRFTISRISFNDPTYYELKAAKLLSSGLNIGYHTYSTHVGASVTKPAAVNFTFNVNANSLDQIICTSVDAYATVANLSPLCLYNAGNATEANHKCFAEIMALSPENSSQTSAATAGELFNQSIYFRRNMYGVSASQIEVNNVQMNPYPLPPEEIYNETLIALGNLNTDLFSGVHPGCNSIYAFVKSYFCHVLSLENIDPSGQLWRSGLDGRSSSISVKWYATFSTGTDVIQPLVFCRRTNVMVVNEGHQVLIQ
jgi:hypothetical protein